jgi:hypothetical protein
MSARVLGAIILLPLLALPALAADLAGPPWPEIVSPAGITLRWYSDDTSEAAAHQVAAAHCAATWRSAALAGLELDGSAEVGSYRCQ